MTGQRDSLDAGGDAALAAVRDAALERGVVDAVDSERYLALAGTAESVRTGDATPADGGSQTDVGTTSHSLLPAALFCVTALRAIDEAADAGDAWTPTPARGSYDRAVREGAVLASRRFDLSLDAAASLAGVPTTALASLAEDEPGDDACASDAWTDGRGP